MAEHWTAGYTTVMQVICLVMTFIVSARAYDLVRDGRTGKACVRIGAALVFLGILAHFTFWNFRWRLFLAGDRAAADWYTAQSHVTVAFGVVATIGCCVTVSAVLWPRMGMAAAALAVAVASAVWAVAIGA